MLHQEHTSLLVHCTECASMTRTSKTWPYCAISMLALFTLDISHARLSMLLAVSWLLPYCTIRRQYYAISMLALFTVDISHARLSMLLAVSWLLPYCTIRWLSCAVSMLALFILDICHARLSMLLA